MKNVQKYRRGLQKPLTTLTKIYILSRLDLIKMTRTPLKTMSMKDADLDLIRAVSSKLGLSVSAFMRQSSLRECHKFLNENQMEVAQ